MGTKQLLMASCSSVCIHSSHCTHCTCAGILHHGTDCYCSSLKYLPHFNWTVGEKRVFSRSLITHGKKIVENSTSLSSWDGRVLKNTWGTSCYIAWWAEAVGLQTERGFVPFSSQLDAFVTHLVAMRLF